MASRRTFSPREIKKLRRVRDDILKNIRKHCAEIYRRGSASKEACRVAAAIAAAEVADVFKERFGIRL